MARDYVIEVQGAHRVERGLLDTERELARELRQATRDVRRLLRERAKENAPHPRKGTGESQGDGVGADANFPHAPGGLRRFAGRFPGGAPIVSLTYEVTLFVDDPHTLAAYVETGTGERGPAGTKYPIYPNQGRALLLRGGGAGNVSGHWIGNRGSDPFRGGNAGERLPIFDHVMHPGIHPRPFLERTARDNADVVDLIYDRAVHRAVRGI